MRVVSALLAAGLSIVCACAPDAREPLLLQFAPTSSSATQGLVSRLTAVEIDVFDADFGARCLEAGEAYAGSRAPLNKLNLVRTGCPAGMAFCGNVELERGDSQRVFVARGLDSYGALFARACTSATLDRNRIDLELQFERALAAATCGDGLIHPPETCESPGKGSCDARCQTTEVQLSSGLDSNGTRSGEGQAMSEPSLLPRAGGLVALYTDRSSASVDGDVALRAVDSALGSLDSPAALAGSFFLPSAALPGAPQPGTQLGARGCVRGDELLIAYESEQSGQGRVLWQRLRADTLEGLAAPSEISAAGGDHRRPAIACNEQGAFVAWIDGSSGRVRGRHVEADGTLGVQQELSGASDGSQVVMLRRANGWIAAWQSGRSLRWRVLGLDGTPSGAELSLPGDAVRSAPHLSALADGRYALSYLEQGGAGARVMLQRFDAEGRRIGEPTVVDEGAALSAPQLAALEVVGGSYAVVYLDGAQVRARYLGGDSGFLLNPIDGTESSFTVSAGNAPRATPTALGLERGVVIAWQDASPAAGIMARLLPLPLR